MDAKAVILAKPVLHGNFLVSGEAHITVGVLQRKMHAVLQHLSVPELFMIAVFHVAVQVVDTIVHIQLIGSAIDRISRISDTVCAGPDHCAEKARILHVILRAVKAQYDIILFPLCIGNNNSYNDCTKVCHGHFHALFVRQSV